MMEFLFGVIVGAFACYVILREGIKIDGRLLRTVAIVLLALIFIGGLLTFAIAFPVREDLTPGEVREIRQEIFLPEWMEDIRERRGDHP